MDMAGLAGTLGGIAEVARSALSDTRRRRSTRRAARGAAPCRRQAPADRVRAMLSDISGSWLWLIAGLILCGLEMFAPGVFLLWLGLAAIATGLALFLAPLSAAWTLLLFAVFAVIAVALGRKFYGARDEAPSGPRLNSRAEALVGRVVVLETAIADGEGSRARA
jgi:membrane protein implicated in regulation of membrane protease activity